MMQDPERCWPRLRPGLLVVDGAFAGDVRIMWYSDGVEGEVLQDLINRFMKDNPDIKVTIDNVSYSDIQEQLPVQLEAGQRPRHRPRHQPQGQSRALARSAPLHQGPEILAGQLRRSGRLDAARRLRRHHRLHDAAHADRRLRQQDAVRPGRRAAARTRRRPGTTGSAAAEKVADSQQVPSALALDRSGHRITGPNISFGANYIGADGMPAPLDQGAKDFIAKFVGWNNDGIAEQGRLGVGRRHDLPRRAPRISSTPSSSSTIRARWQVPNFATKIGDNFDWVATGIALRSGRLQRHAGRRRRWSR